MFDTKLIDVMINELDLKGIKYKDTANSLIILCPYCLREGKEKLKLYISKDEGVYHCFRCNAKGHLYTFKLLNDLELTDTINYIQENIDMVDLLKSVRKVTKIEDELNDIVNNRDKYIAYLLKKVNENQIFKNCNAKENNNYLIKKAKAYLLSRHISPDLLDLLNIKYYICDDMKSNLFGRIIFPSLFLTTYEARSFINQNIRYLKKKSNAPDFPFYVIRNNKVIDYHTLFTNIKRIEIDYVVAVEGIFDSLRLSQYNINSLSLSGKSNVLRMLKFVYILDKLFDLKIHKIKLIFDNDVSLNEITNFINYYNFELKDLFNIDIDTYKMSDYKDINSIPEEKFEEYIVKLRK